MMSEIDYLAWHALIMQNAPTKIANSVQPEPQIAPSRDGNLPLPITKEVKSIKNIYRSRRISTLYLSFIFKNKQVI